MRTKSATIERLLSTIFFFSGFSALIYQVVWQRLLAAHYGVGPISTALIVTVYMAGLGLGALVGGYLAERTKQKILAYFFIELCIGLFGALSPSFLDFLGRHSAGSPYVLSFAYMFVFLSLPTFLMGTTLPLLTKIFSRLISDFLGTVSFLYFINTIGASVGALLASYVIISFFGLHTAVYFAAAVNFSMAILIFVASRLTGLLASPIGERSRDESAPIGMGRLAYLLVFVTGFLALGYEIIWFRVIGVLTKDSPYSFSSVLAVYLAGIAMGSFAVNVLLNRNQRVNKKILFFGLQFLIGLSVALTFITYFYLTKHTGIGFLTRASFGVDLHPDWPGWGTLLQASSFKGWLMGVYRLVDVFFWSIVFVLIPTLLMGASFPLVSFLALDRRDEEGKTVGLVSCFAIAGNALGGVLTGLVVLPYLGTELSLVLFCSAGIAFGVVLFGDHGIRLPLLVRGTLVAVLLSGIVSAFPRKGQLYEAMHSPPGQQFDVYIEEGIDGVVVTYQRGIAVQNYINGSSHGHRPGYHHYYDTIEAMSRASRLERVLVIGYGTGSTVETLLKSDEVRELVLVELNRTLLRNLRKMPQFDDMLRDSRVRLIIDDGRRFLFRTSDKFDLIATDPLRTTTSYSNNLYSERFFQLVRDHLTPGGVYLLLCGERRIVPKTLAWSFPYLEMHKSFCIASNSPLVVNQSRRQEIIARFPPNDRELILAWAGYLGDRTFVERLTRGYPINRDWEPWTEYYIGLKVREALGIFSTGS
jgi:spermidine synthase